MIGYVAKDENGDVYLHIEKPTYDDELEGWFSTMEITDITGQFSEFDNMSYTDEPIKVEINIKRV